MITWRLPIDYKWIELFDRQVLHTVENEPPLTETSSVVSPFTGPSHPPHTLTSSIHYVAMYL